MIKIIGQSKGLDTKDVGGKSAHLNTLKSNGLPVPPGIILENGYFQSCKREDVLSYLDKDKLYAVRSSALDEDGANYSFAGLQDTYLNVAYEHILEKVEACYQSQFNERATEYRKTFHMDESKGMTVIVQEMVDADFAGVIFTQNPLNNRIDQVVVEVVEGLGEKLVSGYATPSTYTINKANPSDYHLKSNDVSLNEDMIKDLVKFANIIENMYRSPQDIEFAIKDGIIYILQARPITTVTLMPKPIKKGLRFYISFGHLQNMTYPITPVGAEMVQKLFSVKDNEFLRGRILYNGEFLYFDITEFLLTPNFIFKKIIKALENVNFNLPELAMTYRSMYKKRNLFPRDIFKVQVIMARKTMSILRRKKVSNDIVLEFLEEHVKRFEGYNPDELIKYQDQIALPVFAFVLPYLLSGMVSFFKLNKLFKKWGLDMDDFNLLVSGLDGNITAEMGLLYDDLLLHYGTKKGDIIFEDYIKKFGMRVDGEIDFGRPRPVGNLEDFKATVEKMVVQHNGRSLREKHKERILEGDQVAKRLETELTKKQYKQFKRWYKLLKAYYVLREHPKYTVIRIFEIYRRLLSSPFETLQEKANGTCDFDTLKERKERYDSAQDKTMPVVILSNGLILKPQQKQSDGSIQGFGVSSGKLTATIRVIEHINDDVLIAGEILVTKFTDPGWTPMLAMASGIITEVGGMMTHGAIVAREYGIPAIVGIEDLMSTFKTGDVITMDGDTGTIVLVTENE